MTEEAYAMEPELEKGSPKAGSLEKRLGATTEEKEVLKRRIDSVYTTYHSKILAFCISLTRNPDIASDIVTIPMKG